MRLSRYNKYAIAFVLVSVLFYCAQALTSDFTGQVVSILDGDTIEVLHSKHPERIRLNGIVCPEKGQAYGKRAKQAAFGLVFGKEVTLQTYGKDKYVEFIRIVTGNTLTALVA